MVKALKALTLKPDSKGRIALGKLAKGVSSFHVTVDTKTTNITLEPYSEIPLSEIPLRERWLFQNKEILAKVRKGIAAADNSKLVYLGDFSQYTEE
jgi:hypothetical protein